MAENPTVERQAALEGTDGAVLTGLAMFATLFSIVSMLETTGQAYRDGSVGLGFGLALAVTTATIAVCGGRLHALAIPSGSATPSGLIAAGYGPARPLTLLVALVGLLFAGSMVVVQLDAADALGALLMPRARGLGVVLLATVAALAALGSERGLIRTLALSAVLVLTTLGVVALGVFHALGGLNGFFESIADARNLPRGGESRAVPWMPWVPLAIASAFQPALWPRYRSARSAAAIRNASLIVLGLGTLGFVVAAGAIGLGARALYPLRIDGQWNLLPHARVDPGGTGFDRVLPRLLLDQAPILFLGPLAAMVGAAAANLRAFGTILADDVYPCFHRSRAGEIGRCAVLRITVLLAALGAAALVAPNRRTEAFRPISLVAEVVVLAPALLAQLLPMMIDTVFLKRGGRRGATAGLMIGLVTLALFSPLVATVARAIVPALGPILGRLQENLDPAWTALTTNVLLFSLLSPRRARGERPGR